MILKHYKPGVAMQKRLVAVGMLLLLAVASGCSLASDNIMTRIGTPILAPYRVRKVI